MPSRDDYRKSLLVPYTPPEWTKQNRHGIVLDGVVPSQRLPLANLPTPIRPLQLPEMPEDVALSIKRDDMTGGVELTGNKVRKLEFLFADAIANQNATRVYTAGGTQSNHARATVAAAAAVGLPAEVFLRKDASHYNGNFFLDELFGATIHEFTNEEWGERSKASASWIEDIAAEKSRTGGDERVSVIPIGGSTPMGTWGYLEVIRELQTQQQFRNTFDTLLCASGSGGTVTGLALGSYLAGGPKVVSYNISDSPQWFADKMSSLAKDIVGDKDSGKLPSATEELATFHDAKGVGYAKSTVQELQFVSRLARENGLILDTCYTGKGLYGFWKDLTAPAGSKKEDGSPVPTYNGQRILFFHTGGGPSLFDKAQRLLKVDPSL